ncbi:MAG TPA: DUF2586 family protein [Paludibacteraceae bacterium]|nr:DUF2586 family protein [Paludibacteraceae bacterium]
MMLAHVSIIYQNGLLGSTSPSDDGVVGMIASGAEVVNKMVLGTAYHLTKLDDLTTLGVTDAANDANANIYRQVKEFYDEAPAGSKLWLMPVAASVTMTDICDKTKAYAKNLLVAANGAVNILVVAKTDPSGYTATVADGLDSDVYAAATKAQALADESADERYAPLFVILPGMHYSGTASDLKDLHSYTYNRVGIIIGDTKASSVEASVGLLAGRMAAIPVQRSIARVKDGTIAADSMYIGTVVAENGNPDVINDKGFICPRTFVGKAGYFWNDDLLATAVTDDYALTPRRRVIDKAYRIAYRTLVEELGNDIAVTDDGKIPAAIAKNIQNEVERAIENEMTANGNLGVNPTDDNDTGVECYVDYNQNIVSSSTLNVQLRVKPYGYAKYINCYLGFKTAK